MARKTPPVDKKSPDAPLNAREARFVLELMVDNSPSKAAERAGYAARSASSVSGRMMKKPKIIAAIEKERSKLREAVTLDADAVLKQYANLAFFDIRKAYAPDGKLLPLNELPPEVATAITAIDTTETEDGGRVRRVKFAPKIAALEAIGKHLGMFAPKRVEVSGPNGGPIPTAAEETARGMDDATLRRVMKAMEGGK